MLEISKWIEYGVVFLIILFALVFSFSDFLVEPAYWFDEAVTIEIARNFELFGELDILTSPGVFSGVSYIAGTNGYPLTIPLAGWFHVMGYGLAQARLFMLLWLAACLAVTYAITRKIYGIFSAFAALLLVASFASFYGNGLTATGEVPGFIFFLLTLYLIACKKEYALAGISAGLAMAAKPGVYLILAHSIFLFVLFAERGTRIKSFLRFAAGIIPPLVIWILLSFPMTKDTFFSTVVYALNPFDIPVLRNMFDALPLANLNKDLIVPSSGGVLMNIKDNMTLLLTSSTGIYFLLIFIAVFLAFLFAKNQETNRRRFIKLALIYGAFAFVYFLRGPGWIRYLFGFQVLFLILLAPSLQTLFGRVKEKFFPRFSRDALILYLGIAILFGAQAYHLLYLSNIPRSHAPLDAVSYVIGRMREDTRFDVGLVNVPEVAAFSDPLRTYHMIWLQRTMSPFGASLFADGKRPGLVITDGKDFLLGPAGEGVLQSEYIGTKKFGRYRVYELIR